MVGDGLRNFILEMGLKGKERSKPEHFCSLGLDLHCCAMLAHAPETKHSAESTKAGAYDSPKFYWCSSQVSGI